MVHFEHVKKNYADGLCALEDVNLHVDKGEFVFIVGASGAGKSTLLKLILREELPTAGTVRVNNVDVARLRRREIPFFRRSIGVVFQDFRLIPHMTVYENVAFALRVTNAPVREIRKRVPFFLNLVGLADKARQMPEHLSGGEQQRVSLARALVNTPSLLIADEPTGNIDPAMSCDIVDLLGEINRCGTTVLMVTHQIPLVQRFGHRTVAISQGRVVHDGRIGGGSARKQS
ncbi:MAG: cell division ATP-binding protein FtsE [Pygmaiobacter sp.]|nr:cell division ATP-binding protein FtsE [Pygmaiobacter sp.]